jgi:hypothetical protein
MSTKTDVETSSDHGLFQQSLHLTPLQYSTFELGFALIVILTSSR